MAPIDGTRAPRMCIGGDRPSNESGPPGHRRATSRLHLGGAGPGRDAARRPDPRAVAGLFETVRSAYPEAREPLRQAIAEVMYRERKYWKELPKEEARRIGSRFMPVSRTLPFRYDCDKRSGNRIGIATNNRTSRPWQRSCWVALRAREMWRWLTSGDAADGWRFGEALAEQDTEGRLLRRHAERRTNW